MFLFTADDETFTNAPGSGLHTQAKDAEIVAELTEISTDSCKWQGNRILGKPR